MRKLMGSILVVLVLLAGYPAFAIPITVDFSFSDTINGGDITGYVLGLEYNSTVKPATSVFVTSNTAGYGIGEYVGNPTENAWSVLNGVVTRGSFISYGVFNTTPDVTCCTLIFLPVLPDTAANLTPSAEFGYSGPRSLVTFSVRETPVPAPFALIGVGLLALGISRRSSFI